MSEKGLYFIAIVPPTPVLEEASALKQHFRDRYQSKASLRSPPHITLHMPFDWKTAKEERLKEALRRFASTQSSVAVSLNGFGCFRPKVIYMAIDQSEELKALEKALHRFCKVSLNLFNARYKDKPYHPHLTIAFRDLRKKMFEEAWKEFEQKSFSARFNATAIALLRHDGSVWRVVEEFPLEFKVV